MPRDFNSPCQDRPGVSIGEDLTDKLLTCEFERIRLREALDNLIGTVSAEVGRYEPSKTRLSAACREAGAALAENGDENDDA